MKNPDPGWAIARGTRKTVEEIRGRCEVVDPPLSPAPAAIGWEKLLIWLTIGLPLFVAFLLLAMLAFGADRSFPDPNLTPGAVWTADAAKACTRPLSPRPSRGEWLLLKFNRMTAYRIPWSRRGEFELDDLIPRCIGGESSILNLWPQPWAEARSKDAIERRMCIEFCKNDRSDDGLVSLQHWFASGGWRWK